ncbi:hypothetical protein KL921_001446 [Ogataea angusta]|uniref:54S ribosomal protein L27, mitochondrial n=1 Tax=Pichia angusta TaxID=870730 RepID=A0AAN6DGF6_PICAN|nr:uncharacterized protein KL928_002683 [Ogataea angusta]KAG7812214.1 hypothetical protein KL921_001446 [Ogataea angusta]KAG7818815.1 hypothetical protein KL928_002683 [Ogataea angusta]KAG7825062.1 hypothetical protein KL909_001354 [Ogataea angusta]KAG7830248.1 hypothetical protein KL920_001886 [Ogataea angusta]KAG7834620.1 hypothetical protein KL943_003004 [Ogataea angusta]
MRSTNVLHFQETQSALLRRPWKTYRDGTLFYGMTKTGNKRVPLTTKQGNKNFYKGTRSSGIGRLNKWGTYNIDYQRVRTFVAPSNLADFNLKPLVSSNAVIPKNTFDGYSSVTDGKFLFDKVKEYIETGEVKHPRTEDYIERA